MGVETATYIADFDGSLPSAADLRSQGDDHIRLVKTVLKNTLTGATRAFQVPTALAKAADYVVLKADGESTIYVSTAGGAVNLTLPVLVALDVGWKVHFIKTNSGVNPMFIAPPSGTINSGGISGLAKARRGVPGVRVTAIWDGTGFFVTRALALPIASIIDYTAGGLPAGFEYPNGQTLAAAATNYPEYNSVIGSGITVDSRGRVKVPLDNLGGAAAGRLGAIISGTGIANVGGSETVVLDVTMMPAHAHGGATGTMSANASHTHSYSIGTAGNQKQQAAGPVTLDGLTGTTTGSTNTDHTHSIASQGGGLAHSNLQPSIMVNQLLVVE